MKKFLLSMAMVACGITAAQATDYVLFENGAKNLTWVANDVEGFTAEVTVEGKNFVLTMAKESATNALMDPTGTESVRVYKNSSITISSADVDMKKITLTATASKYSGDQTVSDGWTCSSDGLTTTLVNTNDANAKSLVFTASNNQFRILSMVISDEAGEVDPEPEPEPVVPAGVEVKSVKETLALESGTQVYINYDLNVAFKNNKNVFVCDEEGNFIQIYQENAYEINDVIPAGWNATYTFYNKVTPELTDATLPAASGKKEFVAKEVAASEISNDLVNSVVLLKDVVFENGAPSAKENFTGKVGDLEFTFRNNYSLPAQEAGTYNVTILVQVYNGTPSLYVINYENVNGGSETPEPEPEPEPEATVVNSVAETIALESNTLVTVNYELNVAFKNYSNVFACDEEGNFIQIYNSNEYEINDVIPAGWNATYTLYSGATPELTNATLPAASGQKEFTPKAVEVSELSTDLVNSVVLIKDVVLAEGAPDTKSNFTGMVGDTEVTFRNNYTLAGVPAGKYDITVVVTIYQGNYNLYTINYAEATTGVEAIEAENAEAVYYNLQGVKVANPENGLFIRVQGNKATKVIL